MTGYIIAALVCIALSAFFSAAEMAFSSSNRIRLENMAESGSRAAACAVKVIDKFDNTLSSILIGNNFVNISLSSLASLIAIVGFGEQYTWLASIISTIAVIIFGETIPKMIAKKNANGLSLRFAYVIRALSIVLTPVVFVVVKLVGLILSPFKGQGDSVEQDMAVEELQTIIEIAEDEEVIDEDQSELLQAALDFNDISAFEVMTARVDVLAIDIDDDWEDNLKLISSATYSRLPVYQDSIDNVIGFLYLNHFYKALLDSQTADIRSLLIKPCYVYKTQKLPAVLAKLKTDKKYLAVVTDEYGGTLGIITMEDILEQIVGDIWDETDTIEDEIVEHPDGVYELDGDMVISDFLELLEFDETEFSTDSATVGGWTLEMFGEYPKDGHSFTFRDLVVTVLKMDGMRVEKVLVKVVRPEEKSN